METDGADTTDGGDAGDAVPADYEPSPVGLRILLHGQYRQTVRALLGDAAAEVADPPVDTALNGFAAIAAAQLALGDAEVQRYEDSAREVAAAGLPTARSYHDCAPTQPTDGACHQEFVETFGRLAFRRPLTGGEVERYVAVAQVAAADVNNFDGGTQAVVAAMLQSPLFLYQVEIGEADAKGRLRLTGPEIATRLAFFLTGRGPDSDLLDVAERGELDTEAGIRAAAETLVEAPDARGAFVAFVDELFRLHELDGLAKDPAVFAGYDDVLAEAMAEETRRFAEHVAFESDDVRALFDADYTFVNARLAEHYGIDGVSGDAFVEAKWPNVQGRGGVLGHASVLSVHAHVTTTSPTLRGKFVREALLCETIPAPPPDVATDLPVGSTRTLRERLEQHMQDASCRGCHALMDGIGFGLEAYDGVGAFRTEDNGFPIDDVSELAGKTFAGAGELGALLRDDPATMDCLVFNLYRYATGHLETGSESDVLLVASEALADSGYQLPVALVEIAASPSFRIVGDPI